MGDVIKGDKGPPVFNGKLEMKRKKAQLELELELVATAVIFLNTEAVIPDGYVRSKRA
jgi:hypothetical protein